MYAGLQPNSSAIAFHVLPAASNRINRARFEFPAASFREFTRRFNSAFSAPDSLSVSLFFIEASYHFLRLDAIEIADTLD
jgi:hypothetical protein